MICNSCEDKRCNPDQVVEVVNQEDCPIYTEVQSSCDKPLYVVICDDLTPPPLDCEIVSTPSIDDCAYVEVTTCFNADGTVASVSDPVVTDKPLPSVYLSEMVCDETTNLQTLICYEIPCMGTGEKVEIKREATDIVCDENTTVDVEYVCDE